MSKNITVWRVENEFGCGPYNGKGNILEYFKAQCRNEMQRSKYRPVPWQDENLSKTFPTASRFLSNPQYFSGFAKIKDYERWFSSDNFKHALDATCFFLTRYSAPEDDVLLGKRQVLLTMNRASITGFRRCNEIGVMLKKSDIVHKPITQFLKRADRSVEMLDI